MKSIKQIRKNYDIITEAKELEADKLMTLVRAGLFEENRLPIIKRALDKDPSTMTIAERRVVVSLLESLMSEFVAMNYDQLNEAAGHLTKLDTRVKQGYPTDKEMPFIIILKRKAIRVYPDNQKVGLYYSQALDKYVSIPFGPNMGSISEALNPNYQYQGTLSDKESNPRYVTHTYTSGGKTKVRRADLYAQRVADLDPSDYKQLQKAISSDPSMRWYETLGAKAGAAYARWKDKPSAAPAPSSSRVPNTQSKVPVSASPWGSATTKPSKAAAAPTATPTASTSAAPKSTTPKATKAAATPKIPVKKGRMTKQKQEKMGLGDQPDFAFPDVEKKTKTFTYRSTEAPARELTPLEKSSGTERPQAQLPRKRLGFDPKPVGTGPQPEVKTKAPGKRFMQKLQEKRELDEAAPLAIPLVASGARIAAPYLGRLASKYAPTIAKTLGVGVGAKVTTDAMKGATDTASREREDEKKVASDFDAKKALTTRIRRDERDAAEIAKISASSTKPAEMPAAPVSRDIAAPQDQTQQIPGAAAPAADVVKPETQVPDLTGVGAAVGATAGAVAGASVRTRANAAARTRADRVPPGKGELEIPMPDDGPSPEKDIKRPPKFGMDVSLNRPQGFDTGVIRDVRLRNAYLNSMQGSPQGPAMGRGLKESSAEERELLRRMTRDRAKTYTYQFSSKANTSAPQSSSSSTPLTYQRRVQQRELQYYTQPQSVTESIDYMLSNNIDEMNINIKGIDIKINSAIANKINNLYESLNDENKTKMVNMLEESADSFKQILNFAVRQ